MSEPDELGPLAARVPEAVRRMHAYQAPRAEPGRRIKLDANELPFAVPAELRARLGAALAEVPLERYPDVRARQLREVVARGLGAGEAQLVFGNGSDELIALLVAAFGGPILYPVPTFVYYGMAAAAHGVEAIEVPLGPRFELDEAAIEAAIAARRPGVVFLALPNNPTGTLWRMDLARELAARHPDTVIVSDEAYFAYCGRTNLPHLAAHRNLVVMRTLSKIGMAGLRVGYTISSPAVAAVLDKLRPPYNLSALDQRAAVFMLTEAAAWCDARAAEVVAERDRLAGALARLPGVEVFPSEANLLFVRLPRADVPARLAARGIDVRAFAAMPGCARLTVGTPAENRELLAALTELCAS